MLTILDALKRLQVIPGSLSGVPQPGLFEEEEEAYEMSAEDRENVRRHEKEIEVCRSPPRRAQL